LVLVGTAFATGIQTGLIRTGVGLTALSPCRAQLDRDRVGQQ
jgi:hypothetical protein